MGQAAGQVEPAVGWSIKPRNELASIGLINLFLMRNAGSSTASLNFLLPGGASLGWAISGPSTMPSMVGGPCRACKATLFTGSPVPSMRCSAAVASVSCPALVRRVASSSSAGREKFMVMAFCVGP